MNSRIDRYAVHLRIFAHDDTNTLEEVLLTFGTAARSAEKRINDAAKTDNGEEIAEVTAEQRMLIENLLGCAFIAAQTYIELVVARTVWLRQRVKKQGHHDLKTTNDDKHKIIQYSDLVPNTTYSKIELINAFANYFKHHEGWLPKWDDTIRQDKKYKAKYTIHIIRTVGASEDSSDNCRKGLVALGIDPVFDVFKLAEILREWHAKLTNAYKQELRSLDQSCRVAVRNGHKLET
jgi:hypothetical protein